MFRIPWSVWSKVLLIIYTFREISPLVKSGIMKFVPKNRYEEYQIR
jgi:hypothetical protein